MLWAGMLFLVLGAAPQAVSDELPYDGSNPVICDNDGVIETKSEWFNPIRFLEHVDILKSGTASGGYVVGRTEPGEWIRYTVKVARTGAYDLTVAVASEALGGVFRIEFDGVDKTGPLAVPDTGGWDAWQAVSCRGVALDAGVQAMRVVMDSVGPTGAVGDFDYIRLDRANTPR